MRVTLAHQAGFCTGVKRAVQLALVNAARNPGHVFLLGDIVHNQAVVKKLRQSGARVVCSLRQVPRGDTVLIRAHGAAPAVFRAATRRGLRIVDATCPMVTSIHHKARALQRAGLAVAIIGEARHDEVLGIAGELRQPFVLSSPRDVFRLPASLKKIGLVVQSTQSLDQVREIVTVLLGRVPEIHLLNTICAPTLAHQREIKTLPKKNDAMVIIGSTKSCNTKRLYEISRKLNQRTYWVENAAGLKPSWFRGLARLGVTAGASTPDEVIKEVIAKLKKY